jgi:hypothetical protein
MTDNEIIKDWKWHISPVHCNGMEIYSAVVECSRELAENTLDLINRQKAEVERLNIESETLATQLKGAYEQICKLNMAKPEAIEEFAEELEYFVLNEDIEVAEPKCKDYDSYVNGANQFRHQIKNGINNLVKEMTEGI